MSKIKETQSSNVSNYNLVADNLAVHFLGESIAKGDSIASGLSYMNLSSRGLLTFPVSFETIPANVLKVLLKNYAGSFIKKEKDTFENSLNYLVKRPLLDAKVSLAKLKSSIETSLKDVELRLSPTSQNLIAKLLAIKSPVSFPFAIIDSISFRDISAQNINFIIDKSLIADRNVQEYLDIRKTLKSQKDRVVIFEYLQYFTLDNHLLEQIKVIDEALK